jgi:hypothetical protein
MLFFLFRLPYNNRRGWSSELIDVLAEKFVCLAVQPAAMRAAIGTVKLGVMWPTAAADHSKPAAAFSALGLKQSPEPDDAGRGHGDLSEKIELSSERHRPRSKRQLKFFRRF